MNKEMIISSTSHDRDMPTEDTLMFGSSTFEFNS